MIKQIIWIRIHNHIFVHQKTGYEFELKKIKDPNYAIKQEVTNGEHKNEKKQLHIINQKYWPCKLYIVIFTYLLL